MKKIYKNSVIEKEYIKYLKDQKIKIVSFDIFETLVFRKVAKPVNIFEVMSKNKYIQQLFINEYSFKNYRISAEKKARQNKKENEDVTLTEIYKYLPLTEIEQKNIIKIEIQEENKNIFVNTQLDNWIKIAHDANKKVILISDMYHSKKVIFDIAISKLKNKDLISHIFISNEEKVTKTTGNLYLKIKDKLQFNFDEQLHIGDNEYSDINIAKQFQINTIYYNLNPNLQETSELEYQYLGNKLPRYNNIRVLSTLSNPYVDKENQFFFNLGSNLFGPLIWEFSQWLRYVYKKEDLEQINFVMREGKIFQKYLNMIDPSIDTNLIYASRASTYLASIDIEEIKEKGLDFFAFRMFFIKDFYNKFDLKIQCSTVEKYKNLTVQEAEQINIKNHSILHYISIDFKNQIKTIEKNIKSEKKKIKLYFKQLNLKSNSITIDFGGQGTILKRLNEISEFSKFHGLFYMNEGGYSLDREVKQLSFLTINHKTKKSIKLITRSPEIFEILFNGLEKTTLGQKFNNNKIVPILDENNITKKHIIKSFNQGVKNFFQYAKEYKLKRNSFNHNDLCLLSSRMLEVPTSEEVNYLGNLDHNVGGGSSATVKLIDKSINIQENLNEYFMNYSNNILLYRDSILWVNGLISMKDKNLIKQYKGFSNNIEQNNSEIIIKKINDYKEKSIYVYGAGKYFDSLYPFLKYQKINILGLIDARANHQSFKYNGYTVNTLENTNLQDGDTIIVASDAFAKQITLNIEKVAKSKKIYINVINSLG